ncbi:hypothetical protein BGZ60DRAFT_25963 [Tricladium varicosporioides]|nr:hypothetical protein BGZ60DRAFT_25963 [Hymenoscyphus varicosporioides]
MISTAIVPRVYSLAPFYHYYGLGSVSPTGKHICFVTLFEFCFHPSIRSQQRHAYVSWETCRDPIRLYTYSSKEAEAVHLGF